MVMVCCVSSSAYAISYVNRIVAFVDVAARGGGGARWSAVVSWPRNVADTPGCINDDKSENILHRRGRNISDQKSDSHTLRTWNEHTMRGW